MGRSGLRWALGFTLLGLALSLWMAVRSDGVHHDDDLTHLQIARWSWEYPQYLLHNWGRPGFTIPYALPARTGWLAARILSGLLTALTAWLAYLIAARQRIRLAPLVPLLLWLQPLTFTLSYTTLTETPLALYFTLAAWLYLRRNFGLSAATISLAAITRHEAALFLVIWLAALLVGRRPLREWIWVVWAPLMHNVLSFVFLRELPLLQFPEPLASDEYGQGTWLTMLTRWPVAAGVGPLLLALVGLPAAFRRRAGGLWIGAALAYFLAHTVIYRYGLFASGGYFRFLVPAGPVVAVAAAEALTQIRLALRRAATSEAVRIQRRRTRRILGLGLAGVLLLWSADEVETARHADALARFQFGWIAPALRGVMGLLGATCLVGLAASSSRGRELRRAASGLFPLTVVLIVVMQPLLVAHIPPPFRQCAPLILTDRQQAQRDAVDWLRAAGLADRPALAASPWFDEFLNRARPPATAGTRAALEAMQPGDILLWDARECASPRHGVRWDELEARADFAERWRSDDGPDDPVYCAIFEKQAPPTTTPANHRR